METEEKKKIGRPSKYNTIDLAQLERLAGLGLTEIEIGYVLEISVETIRSYKKKPDFLAALKSGKAKADEKVIASLYKRAIGYEESDIYWSNYRGEVTATPYKKVIIPDVTAQIFWLKNRRPQEWRDVQEWKGTLKVEKVDVTKLPLDKLDRIAHGEDPERVLADARN